MDLAVSKTLNQPAGHVHNSNEKPLTTIPGEPKRLVSTGCSGKAFADSFATGMTWNSSR
jgi:hypothetical protein